MQAPRFWLRPPERPGLAAWVLTPLSWIYRWLTARRIARAEPLDLGIPVICVGNLTAGGTGKTPTVIALVERLVARSVAVHVVSRGHGGSLTGPVRVDEMRHTAAEVGDEPLLISPFAPVWIARDRAAAGRAARDAGAQVIVMDDGHQNPSLSKDLSIVVVDAATGFGNGRVIPAGPLREPVDVGLARADLVLAIGDAASRAGFAHAWGSRVTVPVLGGELRPLQTGMDWEGQRVLAFAGIGRPEKFFATLDGLGAHIVSRHGFADHAPYDGRILARLEREAQQLGAQLVTTEKDAARLPKEFRPKVLALPVRLGFVDEGVLEAALGRILGDVG
ncbi:tetraacyldisaccharide 4'-kinase [Amaricoccus tamworthensis]|uniref:tetraacyldisaccharide 4'-kinase n=1 Tax=Amaricoccus tamworthensis TaxID=57002 RepID=UPI003C7B7112